MIAGTSRIWTDGTADNGERGASATDNDINLQSPMHAHIYHGVWDAYHGYTDQDVNFTPTTGDQVKTHTPITRQMNRIRIGPPSSADSLEFAAFSVADFGR